MRLSKLKLAGFKTFVDPTTIHAPGNLVGIVGPNGCGKSNIIDAVRWVLGESRASALRGDSMQDVIFNGSTTRKPVSRASVEMVFDNTQGKAAGQWSRYHEISVKRVLDRSGESSYFINNTQVRRKDVIDLFLGTGLGPRAYAIIEQGMISRIIEAKPEEIRHFLEEAAGVTKYRERRKETAGRLSDARENLNRLEDIRNELGYRVERLESQAVIAARYRDLKTEHNTKQRRLWYARCAEAQQLEQNLQQELRSTQQQIEIFGAQSATLDDELAKLRERHRGYATEVDLAQQDLMLVRTELSRLEADKSHLGQHQQRLHDRLAEIVGEKHHWQERHLLLNGEAVHWQELAENASERLLEARGQLQLASANLPEFEQKKRLASETCEAIRGEHSAALQRANLAEAHALAGRRSLQQLSEREQRLSADLGSDNHQSGDYSAAQLAQLEAELEALRERETQAEATLGECENAYNAALQKHHRAREAQQQQNKCSNGLQARCDALTELQKKATTSGDAVGWLSKHGAASAQSLWQWLEVEAGWADAVEGVLRERISAHVIDDSAHFNALCGDLPVTAFQLLDGRKSTPAMVSESADVWAKNHGWRPLTALLHCRHAVLAERLRSWLADYYVCDTDAMQAFITSSANLPVGVRLVSRDAIIADALGIVRYGTDSTAASALERKHQLEQLHSELALALAQSEQLEQQLQEADGAQQQLEAAQHNARQSLKAQSTQHHESEIAFLTARQQTEKMAEARLRLQRQLTELAAQQEQETVRAEQAQIDFDTHQEQAEEHYRRLEIALNGLNEQTRLWQDAQHQQQKIAADVQELGFSERECQTKLSDIDNNRQLAERELQRLDDEQQRSGKEFASIDLEAVEERLQTVLELAADKENHLIGRRDHLEQVSAAQKSVDSQRQNLLNQIQPLRELLGELRLQLQKAELQKQQFTDRLAEDGADTNLLANEEQLEGLNLDTLQRDINRLGREIDALGAVNLTALEDLEQAQQRKFYLDQQADDLEEAITTLESAIRKIDIQTRAQLQDTYDKVNHHFGDFFPRLFGGGSAKLVLTGEEILDTGVQIVAQPPGKKNTSIHLLSGGEKALTAIALVFAMFQLNPAPFCMLDEVDAPLDDSNTQRYGDMVRRMATNTQFIFISHSKITMEIASQLIGVTMQEQGVSRVVEVDIQQALQMTESTAESNVAAEA